MNRKKAVTLIFILTLSLSLSGCTNKESTVEDIPMAGSYMVFDYDELSEHAKIIAKVKITDTLSADNSFSISDPETGSIGGFYGKRTGRVLEYYKDNTGEFSDDLSFIEAASIIDNRYLHIEGYESLKEGNEYILFLSDGTASGDMSIISCNNGVVRLSPEEAAMNYPEIAQRAVEENTEDIRNRDE